MKKRILLPIDFSTNALNAIRYAIDLYKAVDCDFYFLNVFHADGPSPNEGKRVSEVEEHIYEAAKRKSETQFKGLIDQLQLYRDNPKHTYHTIFKISSLLVAVNDIITQKNIDLLIMGTKSRPVSTAVIYSTNAMDMLEKATACPILVIPESMCFIPPREIVFPTDFKSKFTHNALEYLIEISKAHHAYITILHIQDSEELDQEQQNNKDVLEAILKDTVYRFHTRKNTKVQQGIRTFVANHDSDMIAFINRKHLFFGSTLTDSLIKHLGYHSHIPILVLKNSAK